MKPATNWLKKTRNSVGGICACNTIAEQNTELLIAIFTISDVRRWNHLDRDRTSNDPTQSLSQSWGNTESTVSLAYRMQLRFECYLSSFARALFSLEVIVLFI